MRQELRTADGRTTVQSVERKVSELLAESHIAPVFAVEVSFHYGKYRISIRTHPLVLKEYRARFGKTSCLRIMGTGARRKSSGLPGPLQDRDRVPLDQRPGFYPLAADVSLDRLENPCARPDLCHGPPVSLSSSYEAKKRRLRSPPLDRAIWNTSEALR